MLPCGGCKSAFLLGITLGCCFWPLYTVHPSRFHFSYIPYIKYICQCYMQSYAKKDAFRCLFVQSHTPTVWLTFYRTEAESRVSIIHVRGVAYFSMYCTVYRTIIIRISGEHTEKSLFRARIFKPFKEPRNRFPAWRAGTTRQPFLSYLPARLHRLAESNPRYRFLVSLNVYKYWLCFTQQTTPHPLSLAQPASIS